MLKELAQFVWEHKKWWMVPPIVIFLLVGALLWVSTATPISPFLYVLF